MAGTMRSKRASKCKKKIHYIDELGGSTQYFVNESGGFINSNVFCNMFVILVSMEQDCSCISRHIHACVVVVCSLKMLKHISSANACPDLIVL